MTVHVCLKEHAVDGFHVAACFRSLVPDACGDQHAIWQEDDGTAMFAVADGLGHGVHAAAAAIVAIDVLQERGVTLIDRIQACHAALHGTRGAAVMLAAWDAGSAELRLVGVGNVAVTVIHRATLERSGVMGMPGIVGHRLPRRLRESRRGVEVGDTLVIATDGIGSVKVDGRPVPRPVTFAHAIVAAAAPGDDALALVAERIR